MMQIQEMFNLTATLTMLAKEFDLNDAARRLYIWHSHIRSHMDKDDCGLFLVQWAVSADVGVDEELW